MWKWYCLAAFLIFELLSPFKLMQRLGASIQANTFRASRNQRIVLVLLAFLVMVLCLAPMGLSMYWNGEIPGHRNQYELCADAFLKGQLNLDLPVDPRLSAMENPYDPAARRAEGVSFYWDHAFYNGSYYMYFGVVPVLLVFLPYQAITGQSLTTYHGTQVFAALFIAGIFALFAYLARKRFPKMPFAACLALACAVSVMGIWYCVSAPALYCTPIAAGLALMIWSLYLFCRAVFDKSSDRKTFLLAFFGSLCGALVFGCRPSIALGNILILPLLIFFLKKRKFSWKLLGQLTFSALPFALVAAGLMWYNWARFENPFEFGQAYQLTVADQSGYGSMLSRFDWKNMWENLLAALFRADGGAINYGVCVSFPIVLFPVWAMAKRESRKALGKAGLGLMLPFAFLTVLLIIGIDVLWSPYLLPRYAMDYLWLLGLAAFIGIGALYQSGSGIRLTRGVVLLSVFTVLVCMALFLIPYDANYASVKQFNFKWVTNFLT